MNDKEVPFILANKLTGKKYGVIAVTYDSDGKHTNDVVVLRSLDGTGEVTTCRRKGLFELYREPEGATTVYPLNDRKIVIEATSGEARDKLYKKLRKILIERAK